LTLRGYASLQLVGTARVYGTPIEAGIIVYTRAKADQGAYLYLAPRFQVVYGVKVSHDKDVSCVWLIFEFYPGLYSQVLD
jgi:hypothetical protein